MSLTRLKDLICQVQETHCVTLLSNHNCHERLFVLPSYFHLLLKGVAKLYYSNFIVSATNHKRLGK